MAKYINRCSIFGFTNAAYACIFWLLIVFYLLKAEGKKSSSSARLYRRPSKWRSESKTPEGFGDENVDESLSKLEKKCFEIIEKSSQARIFETDDISIIVLSNSGMRDGMTILTKEEAEEMETVLGIHLFIEHGIFKKVEVMRALGGVTIRIDPNIPVETIIDVLKSLWITNPDVWLIEADSLVDTRSYATMLNDPLYKTQYHLIDRVDPSGNRVDIRIDKRWNEIIALPEITIGIVDSGVFEEHEDLKNALWVNPKEIKNNRFDDDGNGLVDDIHGWNFSNNNNELLLKHSAWSSDFMPKKSQSSKYILSHGAEVASVVAAGVNNGIGISGVVGNSKIITSASTGRLSDSVAGINYILTMGAKVINMSWGVSYDYGSLRHSINRAAEMDVVVVCAAPNSSQDSDNISDFPANYGIDPRTGAGSPNIIRVMASDEFGKRAQFSNYGRNSVDIAAPGSNIPVIAFNNEYSIKSGTSFATPLVSGLAALLFAKDSHLTAKEVRDIIISSSTKNSALRGLSISEGLLNVDGAFSQVTAPKPAEQTVPTQEMGPSYNSLMWQLFQSFFW